MRMRALIVAAAVAACSAAPALSPRDCTPGTTSACACPAASGVQTCGSDGTLGPCLCPDAGAHVDAVTPRPDAVATVDRAEPTDDSPAPIDVASVPDVVDGGRCPNGTRAVCDGRSVSLQSGELVDGLRRHCGACGTTCAAGEFCVQCQCTR